MKTIKIQIVRDRAEYPIMIGNGIAENLSTLLDLKKYLSVFIVADKAIASQLIPTPVRSIASGISLVSSDEKNKTLEQCQIIWNDMLKANIDRSSLVLNVGGGLIGDLGGFAAASFMRGVPFVQIPTTLLSQVDASIGGKVAVNFQGYKNLIGSFTQPQAIVCDVNLLRTLPQRTFDSAFGEIIKYGLVFDHTFYEFLKKHGNKAWSTQQLIDIVQRCCEFKKKVVEQDERELGTRKLLNFGHTIGHALESWSHTTKEPLLHGEAVALGIVAESKISEVKGYVKQTFLEDIEETFRSYNLPTRIFLNAKEVLQNMTHDKKKKGKTILWTLLSGIGKAQFNQEVSTGILLHALSYIAL